MFILFVPHLRSYLMSLTFAHICRRSQMLILAAAHFCSYLMSLTFAHTCRRSQMLILNVAHKSLYLPSLTYAHTYGRYFCSYNLHMIFAARFCIFNWLSIFTIFFPPLTNALIYTAQFY